MRPLPRYAKPLAAVVVFCALVFAYAFLPLFASPLPPSPDEASNLFFAREFSQNDKLWFFDPLNTRIPGGIVHPRSVKVVDDMLVPGGFLGLPVVFGGLARGLGMAAIPFMTPFFAALAVFAWYAIAAKFFGKRVGLFAAVLLATHPAWWYVAGRTLLPNTLFMAFALGAAYFGLVEPIATELRRRGATGVRLLKHCDPVIGGMLFAFALAVRPSEVYWMQIGFIVAAWPALKDGAARLRAVLFAGGAILAILPFVALQNVVYGAIFASGYGSGIDVPTGGISQGFGNRLLGPLRPWLFPLGFAPRSALRNLIDYGILFFWWWSAIVAVGVAVAGKRLAALSAPAKAFVGVAFAVSAWLVAFYGSWMVHDNPDPSAVTIGASYLRYWLPLFLFSTVPAAFAIEALAERIGGLRGSRAAWGAVAAIALASGLTVFFAPGEGFLALRSTLASHEARVAGVLAEVPENGILIADRSDKYFLGKRSVLYPLRAESTYEAIPALMRAGPLYYLGLTLPAGDLAYLRDTKLPPLGATIDPVAEFGDETLYRIAPPR